MSLMIQSRMLKLKIVPNTQAYRRRLIMNPPADRLEAVVDSVADEFANSPRLIVGGGNGDAPNKEQRERCTR
jgi:hypothetical protein